MRYSTQTIQPQQAAPAAIQLQHQQIRCSLVPKGSVICFNYQPKRGIAIG